MPSWGEIAREIATFNPVVLASGVSPFDFVRRKYIAQAYAHTGRAIILYASKWTVPSAGVAPNLLSIVPNDVHGFMEAVHGLTGTDLDLIVHSPGGSPEAAEAIVLYLRQKFKNIRVIVPHMAMSAATMIACAADEIVMGKHSFIGPIDPQLQLQTSLGVRLVPAQAILDQFELAKDQSSNPANLRAWLPMLSQYGPDLLVTSKNAADLGKKLVASWMKLYMFKGESKATEKAKNIAEWLADHRHHQTHGRPISRSEAESKGLKIVHLENDQVLQDAILSVYHATALTFGGTGAVKIIENHLGKAYLDTLHQPMMVIAPPPLAPGSPTP